MAVVEVHALLAAMERYVDSALLLFAGVWNVDHAMLVHGGHRASYEFSLVKEIDGSV